MDDERPMRVLVTGGSGFIGCHLCLDLIEAGHEVAVVSRDACSWRLEPIISRISVIRGDLSTLDRCAEAMAEFRPDAVAHLGWQGVGNLDRNSPAQVKNIAWTAELIERSHAMGAKVFLGLGSQAEFGPRSAAIGPDDKTEPTTLYGESKLAAGRIASRLAEHVHIRCIWMRVFSIFGPKDHAYWMIPSLIGSLLKGQRPALTLGEQLWDFLYVEDAVRAMRLALETEAARGVYALGSGAAPSLRSTIEIIRDQIDPNLQLGFGEIAYRPDQVMLLQADISALRRDLGWEPRTDLRRGLADTVAWYSANQWILHNEAAE